MIPNPNTEYSDDGKIEQVYDSLEELLRITRDKDNVIVMHT